MDETISTLRIEIGASSDKAVSEVNKVTSALRNARRETNQKFNNPLKSLDGQGFDAAKLSSKLHRVDAQIAKTTKAIEEMQRAMATPAEGTIGPPKIDEGLLSQIRDYQNLLQSLFLHQLLLQNFYHAYINTYFLKIF